MAVESDPNRIFGSVVSHTCFWHKYCCFFCKLLAKTEGLRFLVQCSEREWFFSLSFSFFTTQCSCLVGDSGVRYLLPVAICDNVGKLGG